MIWCHGAIAIYESSTRANISHLTTYSFLWGVYRNRPIDNASWILAVFVIKTHSQTPQWIVAHLLGKSTRASRKKTTKSKVLLSYRMPAPETAKAFVVIVQYVKTGSANFLIVFI